jgi:N-acetylglucosamine-6-phosphate deacetylase
MLIHNAKMVLPGGLLSGGLVVRDGRIAAIFGENQKPAGFSGKESLDLNDGLLTPGLVDIHIHGSAGIDVQDTDGAGLDQLGEFLASNGVTGYFPTFVPTDDAGYRSALDTLRRYVRGNEGTASSKPRARILGVHFEGPFVSRERCGALKPEHFRTYDGDPTSVEIFCRGINDTSALRRVTLMTLAPEVSGGVELIRALSSPGVRSFIGHSQASPEALDSALAAGANHVTHFPNALDPLHHRRPGAVGWGLLRDEVTVDCIADFHHVNPLMLSLILKVKGASKVALISDAVKPAGLGDGDFDVWGERISVRQGKTSLTGSAEGTIAGSVITQLTALRNMKSLGVPLSDVIEMACAVPARVARIDSQCGSIAVGKFADLIAVDDQLNPRLTLVGGSIC